jgi:hypothetical protein
MKYCLHYDWYMSEIDGTNRDDQSRKALDHFVDIGHSIETLDSFPIPKKNLRQQRLPEEIGG